MAHRILISFDSLADGLAHRILNFAEDLYVEFLRNGQADMEPEQLDRETDRLYVTVSATRYLGTVTMLIHKKLRQHGLADGAHVSRA